MPRKDEATSKVSLREMINGPTGVVAPLVLNALMAKLADAAGFQAGYLGGGAMGFLNCATEANLSLTQMAQAGLEIRSESRLPLILDGVCGWGEPMHVRHTIQTAEAVGFSAIEIEDQLIPKRAHHHIGIEHLIPADEMTAKIAEAVAARVNPDFLIIARTNAARVLDLNEALRRGEAFHRAGADILLLMPRHLDELPIIAGRLPKPLMVMLPTAGLTSLGMSLGDLRNLGFKLIVDPATPMFSMYRALRKCYDALAQDMIDPTIGAGGIAEEEHLLRTIGLATLLEIELRTVEKPPRLTT